ncbi:MAG: pyridoxamine 5'-phosphate oxidase [Acidobacteria bacterium]|nr:pyridoxamine 5'-phosphate oxidase [Acidobacteriota bacterium]MCI0717881.1 pyridoxamine 5'-phosphate oxidase [Acidobacteriota bacterium]
MSLSDLRREYALAGLKESDLHPSPFKQFEKWFQQALVAGLSEPNAMTLATATPDGKPSARIVLLKGFDEWGFVFFTNYESRKGRELTENPHAALVFYWIELERQVCINGPVSRVQAEESESYFHSRPVGSQLGAWASRQSQVVSGRAVLEDRLEQLTQEFRNKPIPLPPYWGGFRIAPSALEFWQGRPNRLHDRLRYTLQTGNQWLIERLSP